MQISTEPTDLHTSARYTGLLEFTGRTHLQTSIRTALLELAGHLVFPVSTGFLVLCCSKLSNVNVVESKILILESEHNSLEQYGHDMT